MARQSRIRYHILLFLFGIFLGGCQAATTISPVSSWKPVLDVLRVPPTVQRLAILYPRSSGRDVSNTYHRLEGATFQLKVQRPSLRIVDRTNLQMILEEQRLQYRGDVSDDSAVRVGRLIGADSVLIYRVEVPSLRDMVWAKFQNGLPPVMVTSKIIMVESAEVVYHNVVSISIADDDNDSPLFWAGSRQQPPLLAALDRSVVETIADLQQAFYWASPFHTNP